MKISVIASASDVDALRAACCRKSSRAMIVGKTVLTPCASASSNSVSKESYVGVDVGAACGAAAAGTACGTSSAEKSSVCAATSSDPSLAGVEGGEKSSNVDVAARRQGHALSRGNCAAC